MTEVTPLESILEGKTTESQKEPEKVTEDPPVEAKVEDTAPTAEEDGHAKIPVAALQDERKQTKAARERAEAAERRAQEAEERLKKLEESKAEKPQRPDVFEDPDAAFGHLESTIKEEMRKERINLSREMMLETKADYMDMEAVFIEMVSENPLLADQMNKSPNPAKFAYQTAKNYTEVKKLSDPKEAERLKEEMREQIRKEELEKLEKLSPEEKRKALALKTPDLNNAASATSGMKKPEKTPLVDLVG